MSLLDKQEVQNICEHTALRARKWSRFIYKRASEYTTLSYYRASSTEERRKKTKKKKNNAKLRFFYFALYVRKLRGYSAVIHSFDWKSTIQQDGGG